MRNKFVGCVANRERGRVRAVEVKGRGELVSLSLAGRAKIDIKRRDAHLDDKKSGGKNFGRQKGAIALPPPILWLSQMLYE